MTNAVVKRYLSGSTNGRAVLVSGTASGSANTIHTATSTANTKDEVWLYAHNTDTADILLTVQMGGTTSPDDDLKYTVTAQDGLKCILPGYVFDGGVVIKAYAGTGSKVTLSGFVNRITES